MMNNYTEITKTDNLRVLKSDEGQKISETFSELRGTRLVFRAPQEKVGCLLLTT